MLGLSSALCWAGQKKSGGGWSGVEPLGVAGEEERGRRGGGGGAW